MICFLTVLRPQLANRATNTAITTNEVTIPVFVAYYSSALYLKKVEVENKSNFFMFFAKAWTLDIKDLLVNVYIVYKEVITND